MYVYLFIQTLRAFRHPNIGCLENWVVGFVFGQESLNICSESYPKAFLKWGFGGQHSSKSDKRAPKESQEGKQGSQDCHEETQREPSCPQELKNEFKIDPKSIPQRATNQKKTCSKLRRIFEGHLIEKFGFLDTCCKPRPSKNIVKTMVLQAFSMLGAFCLEDDLGSIFEQFLRQMCSPNALKSA